MTDIRNTPAFDTMLRCIRDEIHVRYRFISDVLTRGAYSYMDQVRVLVALDGRCGAGKTTMAEVLAEEINQGLDRGEGKRPFCAVVHMDDFFLRPEQRTPERLGTPGGNVDYERFFAEVLEPLRAGEAAVYRPYDCATGRLGKAVEVNPVMVVLVEGSYACHPALRALYDVKLFLDVTPDEQWARIVRRNGEAGAEAFRQRWIPMEEAYFTACGVREACDVVADTE